MGGFFETRIKYVVGLFGWHVTVVAGVLYITIQSLEPDDYAGLAPEQLERLTQGEMDLPGDWVLAQLCTPTAVSKTLLMSMVMLCAFYGSDVNLTARRPGHQLIGSNRPTAVRQAFAWIRTYLVLLLLASGATASVHYRVCSKAAAFKLCIVFELLLLVFTAFVRGSWATWVENNFGPSGDAQLTPVAPENAGELRSVVEQRYRDINSIDNELGVLRSMPVSAEVRQAIESLESRRADLVAETEELERRLNHSSEGRN